MTLNSCNAIPTQKNIKTYIENFIDNFGTDVLKIGVQTLNISDIDTDITTKFNNCEFYLTLYINYDLIGASITQQYNNFLNNLCNSLGTLLNIPKEDISVEDLYSGSIIFKIKVKSTDTRNSAINIYNTYLNYDNLIVECNLDSNLFENSYMNIDENLSNQAFELDKKIVNIRLENDKEWATVAAGVTSVGDWLWTQVSGAWKWFTDMFPDLGMKIETAWAALTNNVTNVGEYV